MMSFAPPREGTPCGGGRQRVAEGGTVLIGGTRAPAERLRRSMGDGAGRRGGGRRATEEAALSGGARQTIGSCRTRLYLKEMCPSSEAIVGRSTGQGCGFSYGQGGGGNGLCGGGRLTVVDVVDDKAGGTADAGRTTVAAAGAVRGGSGGAPSAVNGTALHPPEAQALAAAAGGADGTTKTLR